MKADTSVKTLKEIEESIEVKKGGTFRAKVTSLGIPLTVEVRVCYQKTGVYMSYFKDKGIPIATDTSKKELAKKLADFLKKLGWQDKEEVEKIEELNLEIIGAPEKKKYIRASIKAQPLKKRNVTEELKEYVRNKHPHIKTPTIISMAIENPKLHKNTGVTIIREKEMRVWFGKKMEELLKAINERKYFLAYAKENGEPLTLEYFEQDLECILQKGDHIYTSLDGKDFIRIR